MANRPPKYQLVDLKLDRPLDAFLAERRAAGDSYDTIARTIWGRTGISVTGATVANWLDAEPTEAAS